MLKVSNDTCKQIYTKDFTFYVTSMILVYFIKKSNILMRMFKSRNHIFGYIEKLISKIIHNFLVSNFV